MRGKRSGFTLVELLAVVGIISVLCALAIAVFSGSTDKAESAACQSNRRNIKAELSYAILLDSAAPADAFPSIAEKYSCPSGGTYSFKYDTASCTVTVSCSVHGSDASVRSVTAADLSTLNKVVYDNFSGAGSIDSGAPATKTGAGGSTVESNTAKLKSLLKANGVDLDEIDAASWFVDKKTNCFYWTTTDISGLKPDTQIYVMKYNFAEYGKSEYARCFSVYTTTVNTAANAKRDTADGEGDYNVIVTPATSNELKASTGVSTADKKDINTMLAIYENAVSGS